MNEGGNRQYYYMRIYKSKTNRNKTLPTSCLHHFILPIIIIFALKCSLQSAEFHGSGEVEYRLFSIEEPKRHEVVFRQYWQFEFAVSNQLWRIRLKHGDHGNDYYCDGTNTYEINTNGTNVFAKILPTKYPHANGYPANVVWFAYCSDNYLNSAPTGQICSLAQEAHAYITAFDLPVRTDIDFIDRNYHIPRMCVQYSNGSVYGINVKNSSPVVTIFRYDGAFSNGFTNVLYYAHDYKRHGDLAIPINFRLQQFRPRIGAQSSNDVFVLYEYIGVLKNSDVGSLNISDRFRVQPNTFVDDYRAMKLNPPVEVVQYINPSNTWLPFIQGTLPYAIYNKSRIFQQATSESKGLRINALRGFVIAMFVGPLLFLFKWNSLRNLTIKNTTKNNY